MSSESSDPEGPVVEQKYFLRCGHTEDYKRFGCSRHPGEQTSKTCPCLPSMIVIHELPDDVEIVGGKRIERCTWCKAFPGPSKVQTKEEMEDRPKGDQNVQHKSYAEFEKAMENIELRR
jgi:hypothetical protein